MTNWRFRLECYLNEGGEVLPSPFGEGFALFAHIHEHRGMCRWAVARGVPVDFFVESVVQVSVEPVGEFICWDLGTLKARRYAAHFKTPKPDFTAPNLDALIMKVVHHAAQHPH